MSASMHSKKKQKEIILCRLVLRKLKKLKTCVFKLQLNFDIKEDNDV